MDTEIKVDLEEQVLVDKELEDMEDKVLVAQVDLVVKEDLVVKVVMVIKVDLDVQVLEEMVVVLVDQD